MRGPGPTERAIDHLRITLAHVENVVRTEAVRTRKTALVCALAVIAGLAVVEWFK